MSIIYDRKMKDRGAKRKVSFIKKRQKELIFRLRQERAQLQCMQEACKGICEQQQSLFDDKKKLLKEPNSLDFELLSKLLMYTHSLTVHACINAHIVLLYFCFIQISRESYIPIFGGGGG